MLQPTIITGSAGRAWTMHVGPETPAQTAALDTWIVDAPWAHPIWSQYCVFAVHLRDIVGAPRAHRYDPAATHEVQVWALNPETRMAPGEPPKPRMLLTPQNFVGQWTARDDACAKAHVETAVRAITQGRLSPETDFRVAWKALFPFHRYGNHPSIPAILGGDRRPGSAKAT